MIFTSLKEKRYTRKKMLCYLHIYYKVKNLEGDRKDHCYMIKQLPLPSLHERE